MPSALPLEICVDSPDGLSAAVAGGADRIELCSALSLGGLTPSPGLIAAAQSCGLHCHVMIRPRPGDFLLRPGDLNAMLADIEAARAAGLPGVVIGAAQRDGALDEAALSTLVRAAKGLQTTLHRAFDLTPDPFAALDTATGLGMTRILTSGQASGAREGADLLARLVAHARGRIEIMAGGGVTPENAAQLMATGIDALHASCRADDPDARDCSRIGIAPRKTTQMQMVAALKHEMTRWMACA